MGGSRAGSEGKAEIDGQGQAGECQDCQPKRRGKSGEGAE